MQTMHDKYWKVSTIYSHIYYKFHSNYRNWFSADKQPCLKNDSELRPHLFSSSLNRAWFQGVPPTTLAASVNPAAVLIRPFSPFHHHHHTLHPYHASTSLDLNQSRHLFHPASGYKLAQDSMTGQFFFIPGSELVSMFFSFTRKKFCNRCWLTG